MSSGALTELAEFHDFISRRLQSGETDLTPESCLELWRAAHPANGELMASVAAVQAALDDMNAGDCGRPVCEVVEELRRKHRGPTQP